MMNEQKLVAYLEQEGLDAFYVSKKENVRYISGYTGDDSALLITKGAFYFITDPRYTEQAGLECPSYEVFNWRSLGKSMGGAIGGLADQKGLHRIAFEADKLSYVQYQRLSESTKAELVSTTDVIEKMRMIKTPAEAAYQRAACDISCRAFARILEDIHVGVTEKELAAKLSLYMVSEGADTMPYGNILISGPRTSLLHGIPSDKSIAYGDFVLMDFGCQFNGYMSDMTRTVVMGKATAKQREVYALEKRMIEDSLAVMKAGTPTSEVYKASLKAIQGTEYFDYHYGNVGHGIGLYVHEMPSMSDRSTEVLQPGVVCTIEPGLYIPGWGGVRIEDQVLITEDGHENLVSTTHELIEL